FVPFSPPFQPSSTVCLSRHLSIYLAPIRTNRTMPPAVPAARRRPDASTTTAEALRQKRSSVTIEYSDGRTIYIEGASDSQQMPAAATAESQGPRQRRRRRASTYGPDEHVTAPPQPQPQPRPASAAGNHHRHRRHRARGAFDDDYARGEGDDDGGRAAVYGRGEPPASQLRRRAGAGPAADLRSRYFRPEAWSFAGSEDEDEPDEDGWYAPPPPPPRSPYRAGSVRPGHGGIVAARPLSRVEMAAYEDGRAHGQQEARRWAWAPASASGLPWLRRRDDNVPGLAPGSPRNRNRHDGESDRAQQRGGAGGMRDREATTRRRDGETAAGGHRFRHRRGFDNDNDDDDASDREESERGRNRDDSARERELDAGNGNGNGNGDAGTAADAGTREQQPAAPVVFVGGGGGDPGSLARVVRARAAGSARSRPWRGGEASTQV
ncbi:hypothetical protein F4780DRAFT_785430, partial [Xylariomycetidae sp. FL0641]